MHGVVDLAAERDPLAIGTHRVGADRPFDVGDLRHRAAAGLNRVQVGVAAVLTRPAHTSGREEDGRADGTPADVALVEVAGRQLLRLRVFVITDFDGPNV